MKLTAQSEKNATGFTLLEMMLVVGIIGLLAVMALPHLGGLTKSNNMTAATRQLLDDVALARQKAMANRTTVYMVFLPPGFITDPSFNGANKTALNNLLGTTPVGGTQVTNLLSGQCVSYALLSLRTIGDQPGRQYPRYLTAWKTLPDGVFIPVDKFFGTNTQVFDQKGNTNMVRRFGYTNLFLFPSIDAGTNFTLPYIAFNSRGSLISLQNPMDQFEYIPLTRGSILHNRNPTNSVILDDNPNIAETPPGNWTNDFNLIQIDWLTGRARLARKEIQ